MSARCPKCGGDVIVVAPRAWCVKRYRDGGCGTFWPRWVESALDTKKAGA